MIVCIAEKPSVAKDIAKIIGANSAHDGYESDRNRLCVYDFATGTKQYVTEKFDSNVDDFCWMADSKTITFIGVWHG